MNILDIEKVECEGGEMGHAASPVGGLPDDAANRIKKSRLVPPNCSIGRDFCPIMCMAAAQARLCVQAEQTITDTMFHFLH